MTKQATHGTEVRVSDASALGARVVVSPLLTLATALMDAYGDAPASPWRTLLRERARGLDPGPLAVFGLPSAILPNGLLPLPRTSFATFGAELAALRAAPIEPSHADLAASAAACGLHPLLTGLDREPAAWMQRYCDALEAHWERMLAPSWGRIRRLLEREVLLVGRTLASGGLPAALGTLHPAVTYGDGTLRYVTGTTTNSTWLAVNALTLMPLACESERILANEDHPDATIIAYAARGCAELWEQTASPSRELALVLGETRATIARALELPTTTSDLAARLRLAPSTVSRHLSALAQSGLVDRTRSGACVFYRLSARGEALLNLF